MLLTFLAAAVITVTPNRPESGPGSIPPTLLLRACPDVKPVLTPAAQPKVAPTLKDVRPNIIVAPKLDPSQPRFAPGPHALGAEPDAFRCDATPTGPTIRYK